MSYNSGLPKKPPLPRNCLPGLRIWVAQITFFPRGFKSKGLNLKEP